MRPTVWIAGGGIGDAAKHFQERALAGAVAPDDANDFPLLDLKAHVFQSPEGLGGGGRRGARTSLEQALNGFADRLVRPALAEAVLFAEIVDADRYVAHSARARCYQKRSSHPRRRTRR